MSKYNNKKTANGFDSEMEELYYTKVLLTNFDAIDIIKQPKFILIDPDKSVKGLERGVNYISDFQYTSKKNGKIIVIDVKGKSTPDFIIKKKMFLNRYRDIEFRIMKYLPQYQQKILNLLFMEEKYYKKIVAATKKYKEKRQINVMGKKNITQDYINLVKEIKEEKNEKNRIV